MKQKKNSIILVIILAILSFVIYFFADRQVPVLPRDDTNALTQVSDEPHLMADNTEYIGSKEEVFAYIKAHGELPEYYITKSEARKLGWSSGSLHSFAPGKLIGGDFFGNYEELLPRQTGRKWTEADIDTYEKSSRGAKRIIFSNDGLIYYTQDHYASFTKLGEVD